MATRRWNTIEDCVNLATIKGGKCLSDKYIKSDIKLQWSCKNNHTFWMNIVKVKSGRWCYECHLLEISNSIEDCHDLAKNKNGKCLSEKYINNIIQLKWSCSEGHIFWASFNKVQQGHWCRECSDTFINIKDCHELAKKNNGECLSEKYIKPLERLKWRCQNNHIFWMIYNNVLRGQWCSECSGRKQHTIEDCHKIAQDNNGKCLSKEYKNIRQKLEWECEKKHIFYMSYHDVNKGSWCPDCHTYKKQKQLMEITSVLLNSPYKPNYHGLDFLRSKLTKKPLEMDQWFYELKIGIEYDGEQHFMPVRFGGISIEKAKDNFKQIKKRDRIKDRLCKKAKENGKIKHFIRFSYKEPITEEYVRQKLIDNGVLKEF